MKTHEIWQKRFKRIFLYEKYVFISILRYKKHTKTAKFAAFPGFPDLTGGSVKSGVRESEMCALAIPTLANLRALRVRQGAADVIAECLDEHEPFLRFRVLYLAK